MTHIRDEIQEADIQAEGKAELFGEINEDLGRVLSAQDVANYLDVDIKTVRKYYRELGGMRLGRHYKFFEKEIAHAIQSWKEMESPSAEVRTEERENISNEEGGDRLGSRNAEKTVRRVVREDRHGLLV